MYKKINFNDILQILYEQTDVKKNILSDIFSLFLDLVILYARWGYQISIPDVGVFYLSSKTQRIRFSKYTKMRLSINENLPPTILKKTFIKPIIESLPFLNETSKRHEMLKLIDKKVLYYKKYKCIKTMAEAGILTWINDFAENKKHALVLQTLKVYNDMAVKTDKINTK